MSTPGDDVLLRWTSTGGGWRSMVACMGYANLFRQANLLPASSTSGSSPLGAISTLSGSAWFATQMFYSEKFYEGAVLSSPDDLRSFVIQWMDSYKNMTAEVVEDDSIALCESLPKDTLQQKNTKAICEMVIEYGGDWAALVEEMFRITSEGYGDAGFERRVASEAGRIGSLADTDMIVNTALAPNSRIVTNGENNTYVYIAPSDGSSTKYAVSIPAAYVVRGGASWWFGGAALRSFGEEGGNVSAKFSFDEWEDYYLYPGEGGTTQIANDLDGEMSMSFRIPFSQNGDGGTTVTQASAASSALAGPISGAVPSVFSQGFSIKRHSILSAENQSLAEKRLRLRAYEEFVDTIYSAPIKHRFAVCSQWPSPCGVQDSYFLDGIETDTTALSTTIGNYHASPDADLTKTMKVLLTQTNMYWNGSSLTEILMHFDAPFNLGVEPGDFIWLSDYNERPMHSPQIFQEFMDEDILNNLVEPVEGSTMTTAILNGTTIDNPAFSVRAGQRVEVLLLTLNRLSIPTAIVSPSLIEALKGPMADMAADIATNKELLNRINSFVGNEPTVAPTSSPSDSGDSPTRIPESTIAPTTSGGRTLRSIASFFPVMYCLLWSHTSFV